MAVAKTTRQQPQPTALLKSHSEVLGISQRQKNISGQRIFIILIPSSKMDIIISVKAEALLAKLAGAPDKLRRALVQAVNRLSVDIQRSVKEGKLTGQVLHVRTGTLRRSINREVQEREDGVFGLVGTNVKYAAMHEYGFDGAVHVGAHVRRSREQMRMKKSNVKPIGNIMVRSHDRQVHMPERSFLRSTLKEFEPRIREDLREAALSVIK